MIHIWVYPLNASWRYSPYCWNSVSLPFHWRTYKLNSSFLSWYCRIFGHIKSTTKIWGTDSVKSLHFRLIKASTFWWCWLIPLTHSSACEDGLRCRFRHWKHPIEGWNLVSEPTFWKVYDLKKMGGNGSQSQAQVIREVNYRLTGWAIAHLVNYFAHPVN